MKQAQPEPAIEKPVTTKEVAAFLRCTERTVANYREQGRIPFWRINARRILYRLSDIERSLAK